MAIWAAVSPIVAWTLLQTLQQLGCLGGLGSPTNVQGMHSVGRLGQPNQRSENSSSKKELEWQVSLELHYTSVHVWQLGQIGWQCHQSLLSCHYSWVAWAASPTFRIGVTMRSSKFDVHNTMFYFTLALFLVMHTYVRNQIQEVSKQKGRVDNVAMIG